jgi:hypothetical protein
VYHSTLSFCLTIASFHFSSNGRRLITIYVGKKPPCFVFFSIFFLFRVGKNIRHFVEENKKKNPRLVDTRCLPEGGKKKTLTTYLIISRL